MVLKAGKKIIIFLFWKELQGVLRVKDRKSAKERLRMNSSIPHEGAIQQIGLNPGAIFCIRFDVPKIFTS